MSDTSSETSGWLRIDLTAYELLGIENADNVNDADVRHAFDLRLSETTDAQKRLRLEEAFRTLESEPGRQGYRLALRFYSGDSLSESEVSDPESDAQGHASVSDFTTGVAGIAGLLCAPDAPYARLLEAALKVRGGFELELPQIVVCGTESQGKSSTLERIAMRDIFPRDRKFCTRMPVRLMLRASRHQNQVTIRVKDLNTGNILRASNPQVCTTGDQTDEPFSSQVAELIRDFISDEHPDDSGRNVIVDREVQIEICAPSVPTIDLIDLPGIVTAPEHASKATIEITRRMLAFEHVLVLAVVSARSESLHDNGIWPLLRDAGKPAAVVLTKVDLPGGEDDLKSRLERDPSVMPHDVPIAAVVPVANRDTRKSNDIDSLRASFAQEKSALWKACEIEDVVYSHEKHGMPAVLLALNDMLREYMRKRWVDAELARCRGKLRAIFCDLWSLGTVPDAIEAGRLSAEIQRGLDAFLDLPTTDVMAAVNVFDLHERHPLPKQAPLLRRAQMARKLKASFEEEVDGLLARAWEAFKTLAMREVLDKSQLPLKIGRFAEVVEHVVDTLDRTFERTRAEVREGALESAEVQLRRLLTRESDPIDGAALWREFASAITVEVVYAFTGNVSTCELVPSQDVNLRENPDVAMRRSDLLEELDAAYATAKVLEGLRGEETLPEDIAAARSLRFGGPTSEVEAQHENGDLPGGFIVGAVEDILFPGLQELLAYAEEHGRLPDEAIYPRIFEHARAVQELIRHCPEEALKKCKELRSPLLADRDFVLAAAKQYGGALAFTSEELRADKSIVLAAVQQDGEALQHASEELRADRYVVLAAVRQAGRALRLVFEDLRADRDVVLAAVQQDGEALQYASLELRADKDVVLAAVKQAERALRFAPKNFVLTVVKQNPMAFRHASEELRADKDVVLAAVQQNGEALQHASEELRADKALVVAAVEQAGRTLRFAAEDLRADKGIVLAAVHQAGEALQYASEELRADQTFILASVKQAGRALRFASEDLRADWNFVLAAVQQNAEALQHASEELCSDMNFVLAAVRRAGRALRFVSEELHVDRDFICAVVRQDRGRALPYASKNFMLAVVKQQPTALLHASEELRADKDVVLVAVNQNGCALQYASDGLRADRDVVLAALGNHAHAYQYASQELRADKEVFKLFPQNVNYY